MYYKDAIRLCHLCKLQPQLPFGSCTMPFWNGFKSSLDLELALWLDSILYQVWAKHQSGFHWTQVGGGRELSHILFSRRTCTRKPGQKTRLSQHSSPSWWPCTLAVGCPLSILVSLQLIWISLCTLLTWTSLQKEGCYFQLSYSFTSDCDILLSAADYSTQTGL